VTTVAIIQARMGSTRLPGKVLMPLAGKSVLAQVIERVRACPQVDTTVVATTTLVADNAVVAEAVRCGAEVYRGSESDVLARYVEAARQFHADTIVRITADCPLLDPALLGAMLREYRATVTPTPLDYLSNTVTRCYPRGLDAEIVSRAALETAAAEARAADEREHVTPYLYRHPQRFRQRQYAPSATDHSGLRWTLDTPDDYAFLCAVYDALGPGRFTTAEVLALLERHPEIVALNAHVEQKPLRVA
jgi:spore coat polysaccharide biosynthesis protein SpsF